MLVKMLNVAATLCSRNTSLNVLYFLLTTQFNDEDDDDDEGNMQSQDSFDDTNEDQGQEEPSGSITQGKGEDPNAKLKVTHTSEHY